MKSSLLTSKSQIIMIQSMHQWFLNGNLLTILGFLAKERCNTFRHKEDTYKSFDTIFCTSQLKASDQIKLKSVSNRYCWKQESLSQVQMATIGILTTLSIIIPTQLLKIHSKSLTFHHVTRVVITSLFNVSTKGGFFFSNRNFQSMLLTWMARGIMFERVFTKNSNFWKGSKV